MAKSFARSLKRGISSARTALRSNRSHVIADIPNEDGSVTEITAKRRRSHRLAKFGRWSGHKIASGGRAVGRFAKRSGLFIAKVVTTTVLIIALLLMAVGLVIVAAASLLLHGLAWVLSIVSKGVFYIGVACATLAFILGSPFTANAEVETVQQEAAIVYPMEPATASPKSQIEDDPSFELSYREALASSDLAKASFWFGKWQARLALIEGIDTKQAWSLVNREVRSPSSNLHITQVKKGWDEEINASKVGA